MTTDEKNEKAQNWWNNLTVLEQGRYAYDYVNVNVNREVLVRMTFTQLAGNPEMIRDIYEWVNKLEANSKNKKQKSK